LCGRSAFIKVLEMLDSWRFLFNPESKVASISGEYKNIGMLYALHHQEGQVWCNGESCLTESPGRGFEAASPHLWGEACLGLSLSQTLLMWESVALGLPCFIAPSTFMFQLTVKHCFVQSFEP
jgi:hypothetical protein